MEARSVRRRGLAAVIVAVAIVAPTVVADAPGSGVSTKPPEHDPIDIDSDGELVLPDDVAGNGVRDGTGTASDPYVIEDWYIRYVDDEAAVSITGTSLHVVVRNLTLAPEYGSVELVTEIVVGGAENVTIENVRAEGSNVRVGVYSASKHVEVRGLNLSGGHRPGILLTRADDVLIEDVRLSGRDAMIEAWRGSVTLRDVRIEHPESDRSSPTPHVWLSHGESREHPTCEMRIRDSRLAYTPGELEDDLGVLVADGCRATIENTRIEGVQAGVLALDGSRIAVHGADLAGSGYRSRSLIYDAPVGIGLYGSQGQITETRIAGFMTGLAVRDAEDAPTAGYGNAREPANGSLAASGVQLVSNRVGVDVATACEPCRIRDGDLLGSDDLQARNTGPSTVDARHNWWGSPDGPDPAKVEGDVLVDPWRTEGPTPPTTQDRALPGFGAVWVAAGGLAALWVRRFGA